jgi:AraC-like DNA-binding protein
MNPRVPAVSARALIAALTELRLNPEELLAGTGYTSESLEDPFSSVSADLFRHLWQVAFQLTEDPTIPSRAGFAVPEGAFGVLDHLVSSAGTVAEGMRLLAGYLRLVSSRIQMRIRVDGRARVVVSHEGRASSDRVAEEWTLAVSYGRFVRRIPGFVADRVELPVAQHRREQTMSELWGCDVRLGSTETALIVSSESWNRKNGDANPSLEAALRTVADRIEINGAGMEPLEFLIRDRIARRIESGLPTIEGVARELGFSPRSLQRRLAAEQLTFFAILDSYRRDRAIQAIRGGETRIEEMANALGYAQQSSFTRAFKRWTGISPREMLRATRQH